MKALSLTQPWATLVALGEKQIETRSWPTRFRGPVAIHAAKAFPGWARRQCWMAPFSTVLVKHSLTPDDLPLGKIICMAEVNICMRTDQVREAWCLYTGAEHEADFGDYSDGRFAFLLGDIQPLALPIPARGMLGFWEWVQAMPVMEMK